MAFDFVEISLKFYLLEFFSLLFNVSKYFIHSFKSIKVFFVRTNSNELTTKFLFYCFLFPLSFYFSVNISVAVSIFINFHCKLIVMKILVNPKLKTLYCACIFSRSIELIILLALIFLW